MDANELTDGWQPLGSFRLGLVIRKATVRVETWDLQSQLSNSREEKGNNGVISHAYVMKTPSNPKEPGSESFWVAEHREVVPREAWKLCAPSPMACPGHLLI